MRGRDGEQLGAFSYVSLSNESFTTIRFGCYVADEFFAVLDPHFGLSKCRQPGVGRDRESSYGMSQGTLKKTRWNVAVLADAPSVATPESVARTILDVVEKEEGDLRQLTTEVRVYEGATVVVTVFSKDYG